MQPYVEEVRGHLSSAQVRTLITDRATKRSSGLELIDINLNVVEDLADDLAGGRIERSSYADLHASCTLGIARELDWGSALVRPYTILSNGTLTGRFNLGAYRTSTPETPTHEDPITFDVEGYDILIGLNQNIGDVYHIAAGDSYLSKVEEILISQGYTQYAIDQTAAAIVAPTARVWLFDEQFTWLSVVNDLLAAVGYQGIWSDWNGRLICQSYVTPLDRSPEWVYDTDPATTLLTTRRRRVEDYFDRPNRWVFYRSNLGPDDPPPTEGAGMYTYENEATGKTSQKARGFTIAKPPIGLDVADQATLVAKAQQIIDNDMLVPVTFEVETGVMPLTWHFDRLLVDDPALGPPAEVLCTNWSFNLAPAGGDMPQSWKVLFQ